MLADRVMLYSVGNKNAQSLVLNADALASCQRHYDPELIIKGEVVGRGKDIAEDKSHVDGT